MSPERLRERFFAATYDAFTAPAERGVLGTLRAELLAPLRGRVLEIGAGTGANLAHYGRLDELVLTEPTGPMRARLERVANRAQDRIGPIRVLDSPAERLAVADGCVDAVVAALVLCTVADPLAALAEIRRVLRPGGSLVLLEHVRDGGWRGSVQDALRPAWSAVAGGCEPNRDTVSLLAKGFEVGGLRTVRTGYPVISPVVVGTARPRN